MIYIEKESIGRFLKRAIYEVPQNQRKFEWDHEQAASLFDDIEQSSNEVFLGNIITLTERSRERIGDKEVRQIVDGQQRLTTILLLLIAIRIRLSHLGDEASYLMGSVQDVIKYKEDSNLKTHLRLLPSSSIREVFEQACEQTWKNHEFKKPPKIKIHTNAWKSIVSRFEKAYNTLWKLIENKTLKEVHDILEKILGSTVISISVDSLDAAIDLFERTNARGKPLGVGDLVRNHLFSHNQDGHQESWKIMEENSNGKVVQCLRYYQISRTGHITAKKLYGKIKELIKDTSALDYVLSLEQFSKFFSVMTDPTSNNFDGLLNEELKLGLNNRMNEKKKKLSFSLQALKLMGVNQVIPILFSCLKVVDEEPDKNKKNKALDMTISLTELLEKYHFINNKICSRPANAVEKIYSDIALEISSQKKIGPSYSILRDKLLEPDINATFEEFEREFCELEYSKQSKDSRNLLRYIFDKMVNNNASYDNVRDNIFITANSYLNEVQDYNIEHVYPQKPNTDIYNLKESIILHNIGNLWTLYKKENSSEKFSNLLPEEKIEHIKSLPAEKQKLYHSVFISQINKIDGEWDEKYIIARAKDMAKTCYYEIYKF